MTRIEGQVAQLLNDRELVINRGAEHGVEIGMMFDILNEAGIDVRDPETREPIGTVEWPKVRVKVVKVDPKLCVARTFRTITIPGSGSRGLYDGITSKSLFWGGDYKPPQEVAETLRSEGKFAQEMSPDQSYVRIKDPAVQVVAKEKD